MHRVALALLIAAGGCGSSQGGSRQATPPLMNTADPQMMQMETSPENPDLDKDGVTDEADRCPREIEDRDGFEDGDGCPDVDNDRDGKADADDKCPNEPEVYDGVGDEDGCPD
jgi:hypothetical protein